MPKDSFFTNQDANTNNNNPNDTEDKQLSIRDENGKRKVASVNNGNKYREELYAGDSS